MRVLIVDDNVDFAFSLGEILKDESCDVECVHTGEAALALLPQQEFDVVLLDMKLPRISGIEVMFEARKTNASARVFFMSGHSVTDLLAQAADGGTHRIYYQPYQFESLLNTLKDAGDNGLVLVADSDPECQLVIDGPGCNPFDEAALARLGEMMEAAKAKAVTVLGAGADTAESAETALAFASLGTDSMITTKLDLARRYGGLLSAAFVGGLVLAAWSRSASLGAPLTRYSSQALTDLLLPEVEDGATAFDLRNSRP